MAKIFISYARKDADQIADELADRLRARDHEVFLDVQSIRAGARWRPELSRRIKWSDLIVVLVTEGSNESDYVYQEIREAEQRGKTIVPVKVGDAPLPVHLRGTWQAITLENDNLDAILLEIQSALLHSSGNRALAPIIVAGTVIGGIIIVIVAFLLSQNGDRNRNTQSVTETNVAISVTENAISEPTHIPTNTPTNTSEPVTATNTNIPTTTNTPTITLTHTPRPTSTPRPPTATPSPTTAPTQIPKDRILISEDFEDGRTTGFVVAGKWQIVNDADGNAVYEVTATDWANAKFGRDNWRDYGVRFRFKVLKSVGRPVSLEFRNNGNEMYVYSFSSVAQDLAYSPRSKNWEWENLASTGFNLQLDRWYNVTMEIKGSSIRVTVDGSTVVDWEDDRISSGNVDLAVWIGSSVQFDDIMAWSLED